MNTTEFESGLVKKISETIPELPKGNLEDRVRKQLQEMKSSGTYQELDSEQQDLLACFEVFRNSPSLSIQGVFHYKRRPK